MATLLTPMVKSAIGSTVGVGKGLSVGGMDVLVGAGSATGVFTVGSAGAVVAGSSATGSPVGAGSSAPHAPRHIASRTKPTATVDTLQYGMILLLAPFRTWGLGTYCMIKVVFWGMMSHVCSGLTLRSTIDLSLLYDEPVHSFRYYYTTLLDFRIMGLNWYGFWLL
jgi:hypothetical protein